MISDHADWDELNATVDEVGAPEIWVTHGREEALIHCVSARGVRGRALRLVGYGERTTRGLAPRSRARRSGRGARVIAFADLLERLVFTPGRNAKIALLRRYFATQPDPDRGIGLAAVTGELSLTAAKPGADPRSRGEPNRSRAVRLVLRLRGRPGRDGRPDVAGGAHQRRAAYLAEVVEALERSAKAELPVIVGAWLDARTPRCGWRC